VTAAKASGTVCVALLRGVNVGGHMRVPMAQLRVLEQRLGWAYVATYVQSGYVVFTAAGSVAKLAAQLEQAIELHFGFMVPVIVRKGAEWQRAAASCPYPDAAEERANLLHLGFSQKRPKAGAAKALLPYCTAGERIKVRGDAIWIDYANGVARSKVTPAVVDRAVGSITTFRNMKTVRAIAGLVNEAK
jgi:uncharacterized protein (DUF1697 family)